MTPSQLFTSAQPEGVLKIDPQSSEFSIRSIRELLDNVRIRAEGIINDGTGSSHEQELARSVLILSLALEHVERELVRLTLPEWPKVGQPLGTGEHFS